MKVAIGSDHAGFELKEAIVRCVKGEQCECKDFGAFSVERVDYPDIGVQVAEAVANKEFDRGILICGTGIGMSIVANKVPGIRAALCSSTYCAEMSREHNNANVLVVGARVTDEETALEIVRTWLSTEFPGDERHAQRIDKITGIEKKYSEGGC
jgi:ribose 5-phosphate isomerase B